MDGPVERNVIAQGIGALVVAVCTCAWWWHAAHAPADLATLKIVADTARSQAVEAQTFGRLVRAERLPLQVAAVHLDQLRDQGKRNRDKLDAPPR